MVDSARAGLRWRAAAAVSSPSSAVEPLVTVLARWWAAVLAGAIDDAILILGLWRAQVIAAARRAGQAWA